MPFDAEDVEYTLDDSVCKRIMEMENLQEFDDAEPYTINVTFPPHHNKEYTFLAKRGEFAAGDRVRAVEYENKIVRVRAVDTRSNRAFKYLVGKKL